MVRGVVMRSGCCQGVVKSALALVIVKISTWLIDSRHTFCMEHKEEKPESGDGMSSALMIRGVLCKVL